jgi:hypothetical protein
VRRSDIGHGHGRMLVEALDRHALIVDGDRNDFSVPQVKDGFCARVPGIFHGHGIIRSREYMAAKIERVPDTGDDEKFFAFAGNASRHRKVPTNGFSQRQESLWLKF